MKLTPVSVVVTLLLLSGVVWWVLEPPPPPQEKGGPTKSSAQEVVADVDSAMTATTIERNDLNDGVQVEPLVPSEVEGPTATLAIEVLNVDSSIPLEGVFLSITISDLSTRTLVMQKKEQTDSFGRLRMRIPVGNLGLFTDIGLEGLAEPHRLVERFVASEGDQIERTIHVPAVHHISLAFAGPNGEVMAGKQVKITSSEVRNPGSIGKGVSFSQNFTTDKAGRIICPFVPGEFHALLQSPPAGFTSVHFRAVLTAENDGTEIRIPLLTTRTVKVFVRDGGHKGLGGTRVDGIASSTKLSTGEVFFQTSESSQDSRTNSDGHIAVSMAASPGGNIRAVHPNYQTAWVELTPQQTEVTITLGSGQLISGRIVDGQGNPIAGAEVRAYANDVAVQNGYIPQPGSEDFSEWSISRTDKNGLFELRGIHAKGFTCLLVSADGYAYLSRTWEQAPQGFLEFVLSESASLFGFLKDQDGNGIGGAEVTLLGEPGFGGFDRGKTINFYAGTHLFRTEGNGGFKFPGLNEGDYEIRVRVGNEETAVIVQTSSKPLTITLGELSPGIVVIRVQIVELATGMPLSGVNLSLMSINFGTPRIRPLGVSDSEGIFQSRAITKDSGFLLIHGKGFFPQAVPLIALEDGLVDYQVQLEKAISRRLKIVASDGHPLQSAPALHIGLVLDGNWFLPPLAGRVGHRPFRLKQYGLTGSDEEWLIFPAFPPDGGVLRLQAGRDGSIIDIPVPAGYSDYKISLSMEQLNQLGFRE